MRGKTLPVGRDDLRIVLASMRPPQNAGENRPSPLPPRRRDARFNEAPAECGGKPQGVQAVTEAPTALQ